MPSPRERPPQDAPLQDAPPEDTSPKDTSPKDTGERPPGNAGAPLVPLSAQEEAFLRAFVRVLVAVPRVVEEDLVQAQRMSASEYFALMHLSEAPGQRLRMSELAAAATLSLSGMTRIVQRLAVGGLVRRERSSEDGRGWYAVLTDTGLTRLQEAWPSHLDSIRRRIFDYLGGVELAPITRALTSMAGDAQTSGEPCEQAP